MKKYKPLLFKEQDEEKPGIGGGSAILAKVANELKRANEDVAANLDPTKSKYLLGYAGFLGNYLATPNFGAVKKIAMSSNIDDGGVQAAKFIMNLMG